MVDSKSQAFMDIDTMKVTSVVKTWNGTENITVIYTGYPNLCISYTKKRRTTKAAFTDKMSYE